MYCGKYKKIESEIKYVKLSNCNKDKMDKEPLTVKDT